MKKLIVSVFSIFFMIILIGCGGKTINIGFIGPQTGDYANYGKLMTQAIKLAVEEKNTNGGIDGVVIKFISEDSEGKVEKANSAIEKLANIDKIYGLIGPVFSSTSLTIAPKCQEAKIVMITPSATHKDLTATGDFIFRNVLSDELQANVFAKYIYKIMNIRKIAILHLQNDYSQGLADDFKKIFENQGGYITDIENYLQGDKDFTTQLIKIKATDSQALFLPNYVTDIALILEQANQLGIKLQILSADGFSNPQIFNIAGDLVNNVIFSGQPDEIQSSENDLKEQFIDLYEKKWGEKPDSFSINSYDSAKILINAVESAYKELSKEDKTKLNISRERIRDFVASTVNYNGVSGQITFSPTREALRNVGIFKSENKKYKQLGIYKIIDNDLLEVQ